MSAPPKRRVGIIGYGKLGQYLAKAILDDPKASCKLELAFVYNRSAKVFEGPDVDPRINTPAMILTDLDDFRSKRADLIVEVAHPDITLTHGRAFMEEADYLVGSPTTFANEACEAIAKELLWQQQQHGVAAGEGEGKEGGDAKRAKTEAAFKHSLYVPSGAFWGAQDILKMANRGTLRALSVTMKKAPDTLKLNGWLKDKLDEVIKAGTTGVFWGCRLVTVVERMCVWCGVMWCVVLCRGRAEAGGWNMIDSICLGVVMLCVGQCARSGSATAWWRYCTMLWVVCDTFFMRREVELLAVFRPLYNQSGVVVFRVAHNPPPPFSFPNGPFVLNSLRRDRVVRRPCARVVPFGAQQRQHHGLCGPGRAHTGACRDHWEARLRSISGRPRH